EKSATLPERRRERSTAWSTAQPCGFVHAWRGARKGGVVPMRKASHDAENDRGTLINLGEVCIGFPQQSTGCTQRQLRFLPDRASLIKCVSLRPSAQVDNQPYFTSSSAICTAFSAAPLRSWSPETQKQSPLSSAQSCRIRPTWQLYFSAV